MHHALSLHVLDAPVNNNTICIPQ